MLRQLRSAGHVTHVPLMKTRGHNHQTEHAWADRQTRLTQTGSDDTLPSA
ncbi:hypothetical protein [Oxalicibacterium faecigallinarum]|nr:hypothetical protein [Oxalicibacterium faecigallinarum]